MKRSLAKAHHGVTLVELLIVLVLMIILFAALGFGFTTGLNIQRISTQRRAEHNANEGLERRITRLLQSAYITTTATDTSLYFIGEMENGGSAGDMGCDRLTFTTSSPALPMATLESTDDFETQNKTQGAVGGLSEISFGTSPTGSTTNKTGLFERIQTPPDADSTQGGTESVLSEQVKEIGFQFWDGTQWVSTWDTTAGTRRLPASVKVTYTLNTDTGNNTVYHVFMVPIFTSDVTADNPVATTTTTSTTP